MLLLNKETLNQYKAIANKIINDEKDIRETDAYETEKDMFIEYTMSYDMGEVIELAKSVMQHTIDYGRACNSKYNRKLRIEFLVAFDMYMHFTEGA